MTPGEISRVSFYPKKALLENQFGWEKCRDNTPIPKCVIDMHIIFDLKYFQVYRTSLQRDNMGTTHTPMVSKTIIRSLALILVLVISASGTASVRSEGLQSSAASFGRQWTQINNDGFSNEATGSIFSLEIFGGLLYAGTYNFEEGGKIWRYDGVNWTPVSEEGFGSSYTAVNAGVTDLIEFKGQLYASTTGWGRDDVRGQIWRSPSGNLGSWSQVEGNGFGDAGNTVISTFMVFNSQLYVGTQSSNGAEIWRSSTGNSGDWSRVADNGLGNANNSLVTSLVEFDGYLYAAVENNLTGADVWRTSNGSSWVTVASGGFGDADNTQTGGLVVFNGNLLVGTRNDTTGGQIWGTDNGGDWSKMMGDGFSNSDNYKIESLVPYDGALYATTDNTVTGMEVWRISADPLSGTQVNPDGFADQYNTGTLWSNGTVVFNDELYLGTNNAWSGGEVWGDVKYRELWEFTNPMNLPRGFFDSVLLDNGKVLIAGGMGGCTGHYCGVTLSTAELYDPDSGLWASTGSMHNACEGRTLTLLTNGSVLAVGGEPWPLCAGAEIYNPSTETWTVVESPAHGRYYHTATRLQNGFVLLVGGANDDDDGGYLNYVEMYNPTSGHWTTLDPLAYGRNGHTATLLKNGKVLITGGRGGNSQYSELYDPTTGDWSTVDSLNVPRDSHTTTLLSDGRVLAAGGTSLVGRNLISAELYDPDADTWTITDEMDFTRAYHTATLLPNGKVLVAGGFDDLGHQGNQVSAAELYDPETETWTTTAYLNSTRGAHTATRLQSGLVLVAGGGESYQWLDSAEIYGNLVEITGNVVIGGVTLTYSEDGYIHTVISDPTGEYSIKVLSGWSGSVTPSKPDYIFAPMFRPYTSIFADRVNQNFVATLAFHCYLPLVKR
jgi:hypothetical protein